MSIKIEKNMPIPKSFKTSRGEVAKAMEKMEVGDSIWLGPFKPSLHSGTYTWAKRIGIKVTCRKLREGNVEGLRLWRTE